MTKKQFNAAFTLAQTSQDLTIHDITVFDGFGLADFQPVLVTVPQVARLIRWQAVYLNGGIDNTALQEVMDAGRKKFTVMGTGD